MAPSPRGEGDPTPQHAPEWCDLAHHGPENPGPEQGCASAPATVSGLTDWLIRDAADPSADPSSPSPPVDRLHVEGHRGVDLTPDELGDLISHLQHRLLQVNGAVRHPPRPTR